MIKLVTPERITFERMSTSIGSLTAIEVTVKTEPPPCLRIDGRVARIIRTALKRFSSKAACQSSSEKSSNFPAGGPPALTTSLSTPPNSLIVASVHSRIDSGFDESITEDNTSVLFSFRSCSAAASISSFVRLPIDSFAPSSANAFAIPKPSPLLEAATIATFPLSPNSILLLENILLVMKGNYF